jgi:hypothetical protein
MAILQYKALRSNVLVFDRHANTRLYKKLTLPNPRGSDRGVHDGAYLSKSIEFLDFDKYDRCHHGPRGQATGIRKKVIKSSNIDLEK